MAVITKTEMKVRASDAATAWLNASIAASQDESRTQLYRTLSVEFFRHGVQFIGCDGTMLFRTWVPSIEVIGDEPEMPEYFEAPEDSIVVMDTDKFAIAFMRTLLGACGDVPFELTMSVDPAPREDEPPLGEEVTEYVLTLHALGQQLTCKLYDGPYPDWRGLQFGLDPAELVDGMVLATRLFASVGKLKNVGGIECEFRGAERAIDFRGTLGSPIRGLLMPMRRNDSKTKAAPEPEAEPELQ